MSKVNNAASIISLGLEYEEAKAKVESIKAQLIEALEALPEGSQFVVDPKSKVKVSLVQSDMEILHEDEIKKELPREVLKKILKPAPIDLAKYRAIVTAGLVTKAQAKRFSHFQPKAAYPKVTK
jgi:hypothetical protein